jgi:secreted PhoX family phosphatase
MRTLSRRSFLFTTGMAAFAAPFTALAERLRMGLPPEDSFGYGPLRAVPDETTGLPLLQLPQGFRYRSISWQGDLMSNGQPTPPLHDGMAAFAGPNGTVVLVRNHEVTVPSGSFGEHVYDPRAAGGTTTIVFDPATERTVSVTPSLSGTVKNCAGGPTPWGSWLSCEEGVANASDDPRLARQHGYIFEVPHDGASSAQPLTAMGCFWHEAIAVDPVTGIVYETEDRTQAGLYRFIPKTPGRLVDGGKLQMLAIARRPQFDTRRDQRPLATYDIEWVDIPEPDKPHVDPLAKDTHGVMQQGLDRGGAIFARLEGATFGQGRLYVTATNGGNANMGQVWELDPRAGKLRLVFESPGADVLNMPDNICLSPRGGLAICEDGTRVQRLQGLTRDGRIITLARNNILLNGQKHGFIGDFSNREWAGVTYSPDGKWLFANIQVPGVTFAITGPWSDGGL